MTERSDAPEDTPAKPAPPEETAAPALPPGLWVTALIAVVILLLAAYAWT